MARVFFTMALGTVKTLKRHARVKLLYFSAEIFFSKFTDVSLIKKTSRQPERLSFIMHVSVFLTSLIALVLL